MSTPCRLVKLRHTIPSRRGFSSASAPTIKENDVLLIRQEGAKFPKWHLTPPLRPGKTVKLAYGGSLKSEDLIGRRLLDRTTDSKSKKVTLQAPSLSEYVLHSKRIATPIYPHDAATIVSLLDLHPTPPGEEYEEDTATRTTDSAPFEIFEAGTGMGSLTLHMARAIHAANPAIPRSLRQALMYTHYRPAEAKPDNLAGAIQSLDAEDAQALNTYRSSRRAIIHSLDKNSGHMTEAYRFIRNFRRAQYLPSIDFHNTTISSYLSTRLAASNDRPFLSRAVLDLPGAHDHAEHVIRSLLPNGLLVVFAPSISQIAEFQRWAIEARQPAPMIKVIELPTSVVASETSPDASGGRPWDVKTVVPRAPAEAGKGAEMVQIMRPKVGDRVAGGGFVAVLRKLDLADSTREEVEDLTVESTNGESLTESEGGEETLGEATSESANR